MFGKKNKKRSVASITATYTAMINELETHGLEKEAEIQAAENEIARQQEIAKAARTEVQSASTIVEKLKGIFG